MRSTSDNPIKVAVTGARGMIGWHMTAYLATLPSIECVGIDRQKFGNTRKLTELLSDAGIVFHFAGINRGPEAEVRNANPQIARDLIAALDGEEQRDCRKLTLVHASSIKSGDGSAYGTSKQEASEILGEWCSRSGARFIDVVLPHVFGEKGKPDYNSVVSTFCYRLANGIEPEVENNGKIEAIHAQSVCEYLLEAAFEEFGAHDSREFRLSGTPISVVELLERLRRISSRYSALIFPDLDDPMDRDLFNTYRSYLFPQHYPIHLTRHTDDRGWLNEAVKAESGGQVFVSQTRPGIVRGNHFHRRKVERFFVVSGQARIALRRIGGSTVHRFDVTGDKPCVIDIPTLYAHSIENTGNDALLTMFWADEIFDPKNPDTTAETVEMQE